eukprot:9935143-Prorocentrum_lima.AAC.1
MTSSLVGSEMCIRDRYTPGKSIIADGPTMVLQKEKSKDAQERLLLQDVTCLLYTSDAADDM